ncbi:MAG: DUF6591 domain-containing protein [Bacteroidota bacterium]
MKVWTVSLCILLCLVSCKKKKENDPSPKNEAVTLSEEKTNGGNGATPESAKDCDDFVDQFEEWAEEYVTFMRKYKDNPVEAVTAPEYGEMMQKASKWSQQWLSLSVSCAQNETYQERVEEITARMDKAVESLGSK